MKNNFLSEIRYEKINHNNLKLEIDNQDFYDILDFISNRELYKKETPNLGKQHKISHIQKVLLFAQIISQNENISKKDNKILLVAAAFHDCGRMVDRDNGEHGEASAKIVGKYFENNKLNIFNINLDDLKIIQTAILYHVVVEKDVGMIDESKLKEICNRYGIKKDEYERTRIIAAILKDADALDRTRFVSGSNLDSNYLRTKTAKRNELVEIAQFLNEKYAGEIIKENYFNEQVEETNKIAELHYIRKKLGKQETSKNEKDISLEKVKEIFKESLEEKDKHLEKFDNFER